ncbi:MAG: hypothetical protein GX661_00870, partial [Acholeplasmataceae bacterium]|nr:hypothetical protein [Acholeplasmataceae bacterium]
YILKNKSVRDDLKQLLHAIEVLETEIEKTDSVLINETNEDDKNLEVQTQIRDLISRIETIINLTNLALKNDNVRDSLLEFSKSLEEYVKFDEVLYVILTKADLEVIPEFLENYNRVMTYQYKKERLYEREFSFNNLSGTVIEMLIANNHEILMDFKETPIQVKDLLSEKSYAEQGMKSLYALPLHYEKEMFGCAIFTSESDLNEQSQILNLKIACKLLEFKLVSLFYQENLRCQKVILQAAANDLEDGMFYLDPETGRILLTEKLAAFLQIDSRLLYREDFQKAIIEDDQKIYDNIRRFVEAGEIYRSEYRLMIGEKQVLVCEQATPYITKEGIIKFYVGTIRKLDNEVYLNDEDSPVIKTEADYLDTFALITEKAKDLEYKCSFAKFCLLDRESYAEAVRLKIREYIYRVLRENFSETTFVFDDDSFIAILEVNDQRMIDRKVKATLGICDQGIIYENCALHFDIKVAVVRFPRDTYNLQEIGEFLDIALLSENRYQIFNDDIHKHFLRKKAVTTCVVEQLKRDSLELLYLRLQTKDGSLAYEVRPNVPGLQPQENFSEYLDLKILIPFEKLVLKTLVKSLDEQIFGRFYVHLSCNTLDFILNDDYLTRDLNGRYQKIILCLDDYSSHLDKIFTQLHSFEFKVNINYRTINKYPLGLLLNPKINGISVDDGLDERNKTLAVYNAMGYEILANLNFPDYHNLIHRTEELSKMEKVKQIKE